MVKINLIDYRALQNKSQHILLVLLILLIGGIELIILSSYRSKVIFSNQAMLDQLQVKSTSKQVPASHLTNISYLKKLLYDLSFILPTSSLLEIKMIKKQISLIGNIDSADSLNKIIQELQSKSYILQVSQDYLKDNNQQLKYKLLLKFI